MCAALRVNTCTGVLAVLLLAVTVTGVPSFINRGTCTGTSPVSPFLPSNFAGRWFLMGGIRNYDIELAVKCVTQDYVYERDNFRSISMGINGNNESTVVEMLLKLKDPRTAVMELTAQDRTVDMKIIEVEYESYACLMSCSNVAGGTHRAQLAWILSRRPVPEKGIIASCQLAFHNADIPVGDLRGTEQGSQCEYRPLV